MIDQRIRVHPASDWFMRGVVWARVIGRTRTAGVWRVRCERTGTKFRLPLDLMMSPEGDPLA
jgi:hypothetical protein